MAQQRFLGINKSTWQIITIIIIIVVFIYYFSDNSEQLSILKNIQIIDLVYLVSLTIVINLVYGMQTFYILQNLGLEEITFRDWLKIFLISRFINLHISQGSLVYRSVKLKERYNFAYTNSLALSTFYTWLGIVTLLIVSFFLILIFSYMHSRLDANVMLLVMGIAFTMIIVPFLAERSISWLTIRNKMLSWIIKRCHEIVTGMLTSIRNPAFLARQILFIVVTLILQIFWMKVCTLALGVRMSSIDVMLFVIIMQLSGSIRIIPGNFGITEIICGSLSQYMGLNFSDGVIIAILNRVIVYMAFMVFAVYYFISRQIEAK